MILVYGLSASPPIQHLVAALQAVGADYQLLDTAAVDGDVFRVQLGPQGEAGVLRTAGLQIALDAIRAVYVCPHVWGHAPAGLPLPHLDPQMLAWLDAAPVLVVNRPVALQAHASLPWQAQQIGQSGFLVPPMLVTSDEAEARSFVQLHQHVVFQAASGILHMVSAQDEVWHTHMQHLAPLPIQFQAYAPGVELRVHAVGGQVFAVADGVATCLPDAVAAQCVAMSAAMGLVVCCIDLRQRSDGDYVCLAVHPATPDSHLEARTGLPITAALVRLLVDADTIGAVPHPVF